MVQVVLNPHKPCCLECQETVVTCVVTICTLHENGVTVAVTLVPWRAHCLHKGAPTRSPNQGMAEPGASPALAFCAKVLLVVP